MIFKRSGEKGEDCFPRWSFNNDGKKRQNFSGEAPKGGISLIFCVSEKRGGMPSPLFLVVEREVGIYLSIYYKYTYLLRRLLKQRGGFFSPLLPSPCCIEVLA
jgi:hypothetical protein